MTIIDRSDAFIFGYSKLDVMFGRATLDAVRLPYKTFAKPGVHLLRETVTDINPATRRVKTDAGVHDCDILVVALGADYDLAATPGLKSANEFYSVAGANALRDILPTFTKGHAIVGACAAPYKCPPAPSECALLLHDFLTKRGVRGQCDITMVLRCRPSASLADTSKALVSPSSSGTSPSCRTGGSPPSIPRVGSPSSTTGRSAVDLFLGMPKDHGPRSSKRAA